MPENRKKNHSDHAVAACQRARQRSMGSAHLCGVGQRRYRESQAVRPDAVNEVGLHITTQLNLLRHIVRRLRRDLSALVKEVDKTLLRNISTGPARLADGLTQASTTAWKTKSLGIAFPGSSTFVLSELWGDLRAAGLPCFQTRRYRGVTGISEFISRSSLRLPYDGRRKISYFYRFGLMHAAYWSRIFCPDRCTSDSALLHE